MRRLSTKRFSSWLVLAGFALLIFGGKLWLISAAGSDLPTWDQWDAESETLFRPWLEGHLSVRDLFHPHNEHRLVTTKLYALGLLMANGQWDAFVETTANAAVHTVFAVLLLLLARRWLKGIWLAGFGALLVLLLTLPFSWENTLFGFQIQFYFLELFSLGYIWLAFESDRFGWRWGAGQVCAVLAVFTMASGFLASAAVLSVLGWRWLRERRWTAQQIATALIAVVLCIAGWMLKYPVSGHESLKAHSVAQFCDGVLELLGWPGVAFFPWSLALFVPAVLFAMRWLRRRETTAADRILAGLLLWVVLQCLATAYARSGMLLSSRYLDLFAVNVALGWVFLCREFTGRTRTGVAVVWLGIAITGLVQQSRQQWHDAIVPIQSRNLRQQENVRAFLRTNDSAHLLNKPFGDIPYPNGQTLSQRLASPIIQAIMPLSVRRPVAVVRGAPIPPQAVAPSLLSSPAPVAVSTWSLPKSAPAFAWHSTHQPAGTLPVLRFRVAGNIGSSGKGLQIAVKSSAGEVMLLPDPSPGLRWKTVNIFRPSGEWWIEVTDSDPAGWLAFTEPVELGRLSWFAEKLLKYHRRFILVGVSLLAAGAALAGCAARKRVA
jgi:hypothetical protein